MTLADVGARALALQPENGRRLDSRTAAAGPQPAAAHPRDSSRSWTLYSLVLGPAERSALIGALQEVEAARSLDPLEERMLAAAVGGTTRVRRAARPLRSLQA